RRRRGADRRAPDARRRPRGGAAADARRAGRLRLAAVQWRRSHCAVGKMRRQLRNSSASEQLMAALVGGGVVAAVLLATGVHRTDDVTKVVEHLPSAAAATTVGLSPHQIYAPDAPGVVS